MKFKGAMRGFLVLTLLGGGFACSGAGDVPEENTAESMESVAPADPIAFCNASGKTVFIGTSNNDVINGTSGGDCIVGLGGQDTINGLGGEDFIFGNEGDDTLNGGDGLM